jgi:acetate kinase
MTAEPVILCINSGSSSLKFALYQIGVSEETALAQGAVERIGLSAGRVWLRTMTMDKTAEAVSDFPDHQAAVHTAFVSLQKLRLPAPDLGGAQLRAAASLQAPLVSLR